jgi:DNA-binding CsgD family transcriptional regulator
MDALRDASSITKRQRQVIQLIAAGRSNDWSIFESQALSVD